MPVIFAFRRRGKDTTEDKQADKARWRRQVVERVKQSQGASRIGEDRREAKDRLEIPAVGLDPSLDSAERNCQLNQRGEPSQCKE